MQRVRLTGVRLRLQNGLSGVIEWRAYEFMRQEGVTTSAAAHV